MTAQSHDIFLYDNQEYDVSAIEYPNKFFSIEKFGINPVGCDTSFQRGYLATFNLELHGTIYFLKLHTLFAHFDDGNTAPIPINGIMPTIITTTRGGKIDSNNKFLYDSFSTWEYDNINQQQKYSGSIIISSNWVGWTNGSMGFASPLAYKKVVELSFYKGRLIKEQDLSDFAEHMRRTSSIVISKKEKRGKKWIRNCFDLSYKVKWPYKNEYEFSQEKDTIKHQSRIPSEVSYDEGHPLYEKSRVYHFPNQGMIRIENTRELILRRSGEHRVKTLDGKLHIISSGWMAIEIECYDDDDDEGEWSF